MEKYRPLALLMIASALVTLSILFGIWRCSHA